VRNPVAASAPPVAAKPDAADGKKEKAIPELKEKNKTAHSPRRKKKAVDIVN